LIGVAGSRLNFIDSSANKKSSWFM